MNRKFLSLFFYLGLTLPISAQNTNLTTQKSVGLVENNAFLKAYSDSLEMAKMRVADGQIRVEKAQKSKPIDLAKLFLPLTYYKDVINKEFNLSNHKLIDKTLLGIYLSKPALVVTTDKDLQQQQSTAVEISKPIQQEVDLVEEVAPTPIETSATPVDVMVIKPNFWTHKREFALQLLQSYVSDNWYKGGESNYSVLSSVLLEENYNNKQKVKWDNRLELKFGLQSSKSDSLHSFKTTEDLIRLTSKFGLQATKKWYYTVQFVGYTQFYHSYRSNDAKLYSDFLAPLNLNLSVGMDYSVDWLNHKLKGNVHLAPLAYNLKYTRLKDLSGRLGIEEGRYVRHDFGSELTLDLEWNLMEALTWKTRLYAYTTYKRAELEWENTFKLQFNKYIGAQIFIYPRFDDGVKRDGKRGYWQLKEFASIGFQYTM